MPILYPEAMQLMHKADSFMLQKKTRAKIFQKAVFERILAHEYTIRSVYGGNARSSGDHWRA